MADNRSKSILLQVAFKEAPNFTDKVEEVAEVTRTLYSELVSLHDEFGIKITDSSSRGTRSNYGGGQQRERKSGGDLPEGTNKFNLDGKDWLDFRQAKAKDSVKPNFPDFKDGIGRDSESVWMYLPDGEPNKDAESLVRAADLAAAL